MSKEDLKKSADILKNELASIALSDAEELDRQELTEEEVMSRAGDAETFYTAHFDRVLNILLYEQLKFIAEKATDEEKLQFGRGTFNGLCLIKEWFEQQVNVSLSKFDETEGSESEKVDSALRVLQ